MSAAGPVRRTLARFNWRLLAAARLVIALAAVAGTVIVARAWGPPFRPTYIYAALDMLLSVAAVSRLRRAGWGLVGAHLLISVLWCEAALWLPIGAPAA